MTKTTNTTNNKFNDKDKDKDTKTTIEIDKGRETTKQNPTQVKDQTKTTTRQGQRR